LSPSQYSSSAGISMRGQNVSKIGRGQRARHEPVTRVDGGGRCEPGCSERRASPASGCQPFPARRSVVRPAPGAAPGRAGVRCRIAVVPLSLQAWTCGTWARPGGGGPRNSWPPSLRTDSRISCLSTSCCRGDRLHRGRRQAQARLSPAPDGQHRGRQPGVPTRGSPRRDWSALGWLRLDGGGRVVAHPVEAGRVISALVGKYQQYAERTPRRSGVCRGHREMEQLAAL
jgi:hypothetical protein